MAGLCGLTILLLWTGIIGLNKCDAQSATSATAPPFSSSPPSTAPYSSPAQSPTYPSRITITDVSNQTNNLTPTSVTVTPTASSQTSPHDTSLAVTLSTVSQGNPQCSYTVVKYSSGFTINIASSYNGTFTIHIAEKDQPNDRKHIPINGSTYSHTVENLKPCTEYGHNVTYLYGGNTITCNFHGNETVTAGIGDKDIKESVNATHFCYQSDWNITSMLKMHYPSFECDSEKCCFKPSYKDICTTVTTKFSQNCGDSFSLTKYITIDFLNASEITQNHSNEFPVRISHDAPNCVKPINYTCRESGHNETKMLSDLEPFTKYNCTGQLNVHNATKNTDALHVMVNCSYSLQNQSTVTKESIKLKWQPIRSNCSNVPDKFSNTCKCNSTKAEINSTGNSCEFTKLRPYTDYRCNVTSKYKKVTVSVTAINMKTEPGKPLVNITLTSSHPANNAIKVKCFYKGDLNGPGVRYKATLGKNIQKENNCTFNFTDLSYSKTYKLQVQICNDEFCSKAEEKDISTLYNDKAVIGFLVFLIILTSVALLLVIYKIYILKRRESSVSGENMMLISTANDEENLLLVEPIMAEVLLEAYKRKLADEGRLFLAEFQSIPRIFSRFTVKEAKKPCNSPKNRYVDILPYDYNRVQLSTGNGETGCDYINASFIDGYKEAKKYIAAQGPKDETVGDFWRMVWEQQSSIIVMVTRCEEGNRLKCAQYWPSPDRETEIFEEFIVKLTSEVHCPDYIIRRLSLANKREKSSEREVTHIQFMSWPDHGVPGEPQLLLKLRRRVNAFKNFFSGPIVVHCSAGVGRTGTYIGIDAMMEGLEAEGRVDIYGYVVRLRRQRCLMVQVEAQYILIHQALVEHNQFGETEIALSELHSTVSTLKQQNPGNEPSLLEEEFERLPSYKNWRTFNTGITEENKKKNRSSSVIPYDYNRVLLKLDEGHSQDSEADEDDEEETSDEEDEDSTKYINASYINGYWGQRAFIAAQTPLPDSVADFWLMVYQKKASTIVMLSDCSEGDQESNCVYWGKDKTAFGDLEVEVTSTDTTPTFICRNMLIRHIKRKESRTVKQFQFLQWMNKELPEKPQDITDLIKEIKRSNEQSKSQTVIVHCNDGSSRTGIVCALWNLLESAKTEKLVDVFQVVKTLRRERQSMVSSLEQYQFLYDALASVFPVQNGEVKAAKVPAADSLQFVNETKAEEQQAEKPASNASTTSNEQQGTAESTPLVAVLGQEDKQEESEKQSSTPKDTTPLEDTTSGPTATVDV
ncbi:receptor-type tyrosine-protein phosphatase C isoform X3 [Echeneis naucrates]|uniref:receptor-type tyrosine-protein phosphatase C isoform X3 n=1 Tax=Echeneis naucrates TaxID=173247 RepID=UPI001113FDA1|nr:receptor-type tyrosine-protein phosphatase C isoform X3 [Echeneis naucrates]